MIDQQSLQNVIKLLNRRTLYNELDDSVKTSLKNSIKYYLEGSDCGTMFYEKMMYIIADSNYLNNEFHFNKNEINDIINYLSENIEQVIEVLNSNIETLRQTVEKLNVI